MPVEDGRGRRHVGTSVVTVGMISGLARTEDVDPLAVGDVDVVGDRVNGDSPGRITGVACIPENPGALAEVLILAPGVFGAPTGSLGAHSVMWSPWSA